MGRPADSLPKSKSRVGRVVRPLAALFNLDEWTIRRAGGRLGPALRLLALVTLAYLVAWVIVEVIADMMVGGPRDNAWSGFVTVPMVVVSAPWVLSWMPAQRFGSSVVAGYRRLGMRGGAAWAIYIVGGVLAIIQLAVCMGAMLGTFAA